MNNKDIACSLHPTRTGDVDQVESKVVLYDEKGNSDEDRKNKFNASLACAKKVIADQKVILYVKQDREGRFYDPVRVGGQYKITGKDKLTGGEMFKFRTVSSPAFKLYLNYLAKRHTSLLTQAEREV